MKRTDDVCGPALYAPSDAVVFAFDAGPRSWWRRALDWVSDLLDVWP